MTAEELEELYPDDGAGMTITPPGGHSESSSNNWLTYEVVTHTHYERECIRKDGVIIGRSNNKDTNHYYYR